MNRQTQKPEKIRERSPITWRRLLIITTLFIFFVIAAIVLLLSTGHAIDYSWYYIIPVIFGLIVVPILTALQWLFPLTPIENKKRTDIPQVSPQLTPTAISQEKSQVVPEITAHPRNYIPDLRDSLFQARTGEFEKLDKLVIEARMLGTPPCVGIVGMGGIGKTRLALELAYQYEKEQRFPAGIFWMPAVGKSLAEWQNQFVQLAERTEYLPVDGAQKRTPEETEKQRARYICRYLASHADALLLLDNVEKPELIKAAISNLVGVEILCTIIYTSKYSFVPPGLSVKIYQALKLSEESALSLFLGENRPQLLVQAKRGSKEQEAEAARKICKHVEYLPLALILLGRFLQDPYLSLVHLHQELEKRGSLEITRERNVQDTPLFSTFLLSWEKILDKDVQELFQLACCFPEASLIPLHLLGSAVGLGTTGTSSLDPLGKARLLLQKWSLIEVASQEEIRLHPILREFGLLLAAQHKIKYQSLLKESSMHIKAEFINKLKVMSIRFARLSYISEADLEKRLDSLGKIIRDLVILRKTPIFISEESFIENILDAFSESSRYLMIALDYLKYNRRTLDSRERLAEAIRDYNYSIQQTLGLLLATQHKIKYQSLLKESSMHIKSEFTCKLEEMSFRFVRLSSISEADLEKRLDSLGKIFNDLVILRETYTFLSEESIIKNILDASLYLMLALDCLEASGRMRDFGQAIHQYDYSILETLESFSLIS